MSKTDGAHFLSFAVPTTGQPVLPQDCLNALIHHNSSFLINNEQRLMHPYRVVEKVYWFRSVKGAAYTNNIVFRMANLLIFHYFYLNTRHLLHGKDAV
jgi:Lhr-like helicase